MRCFVLNRHEDPTGISGTGVVAEGVVFKNGKIAVAWMGKQSVASVTVYDNMKQVQRIHGHDGSTIIDWIAVPSEPVPAVEDVMQPRGY